MDYNFPPQRFSIVLRPSIFPELVDEPTDPAARAKLRSDTPHPLWIL